MTEERRQKIAERLGKLYVRDKTLTPDAVVKDAENPKSPMHDWFTWDDSEAAHKYRLDQARELIARVKVEIRTDTTTISTVAYVRDPNANPGEQGYTSVEDLMRRPKQAMEALEYECQRAAQILERTRHLALVLGLVNEMDEILAGLAKVRTLASKVS